MKMDEKIEKQLEQIGDDFQVRFLESALTSNPGDFNILSELANIYTHVGRYEDGLRIDRKLTEMRPENPLAHYNLSCSLSLLDRIDEALHELEASFKLGYLEFDHVLGDPDLENLREDTRFGRLLQRYMGTSRQV